MAQVIQTISPLGTLVLIGDVDRTNPASVGAFQTAWENFNVQLKNTTVGELNTAFGQINTVRDEINTMQETTLGYKEDTAEMLAVAQDVANYLGDWVAGYNGGAGYPQSASVSYSDGFIYYSKVANNTVEPTGETNTAYWYFSGRKSFVDSEKTSNYTAVKFDEILCNSSGGGFTITLPSAPDKYDTVIIKTGSYCEDNPVTINGNGNDIILFNDADTALVLDKNGVRLEFEYNGTKWRAM